MACGGSGVQLHQISLKPKIDTPEGLVLKTDSENQTVAASFNLTNDPDGQPVKHNDNAYCAVCNQLWLGVHVPFYHSCPRMARGVSFGEQRMLVCRMCDHSKEGCCEKLKEILPDRPCDIRTGVYMLRSWCPIKKWLPIEFKCPSCKAITANLQGVTKCQRCKFELGDRPPMPSPDEARKILAASMSTEKAIKESRIQPTKVKVQPRSSSAFVARSPNAHFLRLSDLADDSARLAGLLPPDIDAVIGIARSGMTPANIVSTLIHKPILSIRQTLGDIIAVGNGWRMGGHNHVDIKKESKVVVVDDTVMTGNSFSAIRPIVARSFPNAIFAALYVNPAAKSKPDIYVRDLGWPHLLEWNLFNSVLSPNCALDFDGILCHDCRPEDDDDGDRYLNFIENAKPKYLPRKVPVPMIVTARIEKYRKPTEAWLERHGVIVHRLIMHPAKTLAERRRDNIAEFKARHYKRWVTRHQARPAPAMFIESEDWQAREISRLTNRLVICPSTGACYGDARV